jgi:glycerol 3-phosphatase-2
VAESEVGSLARRYDALFVDLDGVVYRGDQLVPGAARVLDEVRRTGTGLLFLTNNSSKTPGQVASKLESMGVRARPQEVLTSAVATAAMLRGEGQDGRSAFVIGERGIREALAEAGVTVLDGEPDRSDLVVVGWDRSADYAKLRTAALLVQRGARLVATNGDLSYPAPDGLWPGAGALLAAVTATTGATPTIVGKPARPLFDAAAQITGAVRPLVVGDRLDTDIAGAVAMGWDSLLVLTGATRPEDLPQAHDLPTYIGADLTILRRQATPGRFTAADEHEVEGLKVLLDSVGLSSEGLEERLAHTVVSRDGAGPTAAACLDPVGEFGLLRSVAVRPDVQGEGLGLLAASAALREGRRLGMSGFALFTETAPAFFERLGFRKVERDELPEPVRTRADAAQECGSATAMVLPL